MEEERSLNNSTLPKPGEVQSDSDGPHEYAENPSSHGADNKDAAVPRLHLKTLIIFLAVALVYFTQVYTLVGVGAFGRDIATVVGGAENVVWLVTVFTISVVVLGTPLSQAADYWGRKWFLTGFTFVGVIGAIVLARADSMGMAIAGATVTSLSFAAQPLMFAVASEVLPNRHRVAGQAALNAGSAMGGVVGLMAGAALTNGNPGGFRIYFYLDAAFYALAGILCLVLYRPPPRELQLSLTLNEKLARLDWIGIALQAIGLILFVMGLSWAENPFPWDDAHVLAPLLIGVGFMIAFGIYEWKFEKAGLFHHGLFSRDRNFAIAAACVFVEGLVFFAANTYFPFQMSSLYTQNPIISSLHFALGYIVFGVSCPFVGIYCHYTKQIRIPIMAAFIFFLIFNILMATADLGSGTAMWGYVIFLGLGLSGSLCGLVSAAQLSTPSELIAITSGLMVSIRSLGGAVGLAVYGAIFNSKLNTLGGEKIAAAALPLGLPKSSLPLLIADIATEDTAALPKIPGITPRIIEASVGAYLEALSDSFRTVWITSACFVAVALIGSFFIFDPKKDFTYHIDAPVEDEKELYGSREITHDAKV